MAQSKSLTYEELRDELDDSTRRAMINEYGEFKTISANKYDLAVKSGYTPATPKQIQSELDYKEFGEGFFNEALAAAAGVARGATVGLSDPFYVRGPEFWAKTVGAGLIAGPAAVLPTIAYDVFTDKPSEKEQAARSERARELRLLEEQSPKASFAGEMAGIVGSSVLTGGGTGAAGLGRAGIGAAARALPAGALSIAGRAAERAVAKNVVKIAGEGLLGKAAGKILGMGAAGVIEGGVYGVGDYVSELAMEREPEFSAEGLIDHAGSGALMGGLAGGVLGGISGFGSPALKATGGFVKQLTKDRFKGLTPGMKNLYNKYSAFRSGIPEEEIGDLWLPTQFRPTPLTAMSGEEALKRSLASDVSEEFLRDIFKQPAIKGMYGAARAELTPVSVLKGVLGGTDDAADAIIKGERILSKTEVGKIESGLFKEMRQYIDDFADGTTENNLSKLQRMFRSEAHADELKHIIGAGDNTPQGIQTAFGMADDLLKAAKNNINELMAGNKVHYTSPRHIKLFRNVVGDFEDKLTGLKNLAGSPNTSFTKLDIHNLINDTKRLIADASDFDKLTAVKGIRNTVSKIRTTGSQFKKAAVDKTVWGDTIGDLADLNGAMADAISSSKNFNKAFSTHMIQPGGKKWRLNSQSLIAAMRGAGNPAQELKREILSNFIDSNVKLMNTFRNSNVLNISADDAVRRVADNFIESTDKYTFLIELLEKNKNYGDLTKAAGGKAQIDLLISTLIGTAGFGGMLAASGGEGPRESGVMAGAGGAMLFAALRFGKNPALTTRMLKKMITATEKLPSVIPAGIKGLNIKPSVRVAPIVYKVMTREEQLENYNQYSDMLSGIENDPAVLDRNFAYSLGDIDALSPLISGIMRDQVKQHAAFLADKIPQSYSPDPMNPSLVVPPSSYELAKFARYTRAINKPSSVFEDMAEGVVSAEGVEVLRELYPATYNKFYELSLDAIAKGEVSRVTKLKLKAALGITSGDINMAQSVYAKQQGEQKKKGKDKSKGKKKSGRKLNEGGVKRLVESETF